MKRLLHIGLLLSVLFLSGCWDRTEINDLAFITGTAFDLTESGEYHLTVQIALPSSTPGGGAGEGPQQKFFVLAANGKNVNEAFAMIQKKSSRKLFTAHRSVIFIGESLGRHGINNVLDVFAHDPRQRLRTYIMLVKGGEASRVLDTKYPFDQVPMEAVKEMEGQQTEVAVNLRDFFISATSRGIDPIMGVIEVESEGKDQNKPGMFKLSGSGVFKQLKLVGLLDGYETDGLNWATNHMKDGRINAEIPGTKGNVGILITYASRKISIDTHGDRMQFKLLLQGKGTIIENNTELDVTRPKNVALVQHGLEKAAEKQVSEALNKLQKQFDADAVGFGQALYRNSPREWKAVKNQWDRKFAEAKLNVQVKLTIGGAGMVGPPLQLDEKEIKE
ncbi:Ger(x)C family spore germination protein [Cohnella sp. JJ-181]|uniref:Ger(x)C family spore germination protein n=1 Tax=Cohnella rhizoplanae TaxID=2974897 RepID=UPI0022FF907B|nr:Ger(x)C family spore germination protein [Cohnella sp. JJ-181]CAI6087739.1 Spore germination protein B3 [Cohnella sp. JJ-181]